MYTETLLLLKGITLIIRDHRDHQSFWNHIQLNMERTHITDPQVFKEFL